MSPIAVPPTEARAEFRPWDPAYRRDPHPSLHLLRRVDPVHRLDFAWAWVLTRYDDVSEVLRDSRFASSPSNATVEKRATRTEVPDGHREALDRFFGRSLLFVERPDHSRLRGLVNRDFTRRRVDDLRPRIEAIADELIDALLELEEVDFVSGFANPLPAIVIAELLGVPIEDRHAFKQWSEGMVVLFDLVKTPEQVKSAAACLAEIEGYLRDLIAERRRRPTDDLLSALAARERSGDGLDEDELIAMCTLLLAAGHETTTNLLANGLYTLLEHPGERARLVAEPALVPSAVEECLRFESPVQGMPRVAMEPLELRGHAVDEGDLMIVVVSAANRDPAIFPDPDRFDVGRGDNRHLAFGHGHHFCLGAPLARLEAQIAFSRLFARMPGLEGAYEEVEWKPTQVLRGLQALPLRCRP